MANEYKNRNVKQKYGINREEANALALSIGNIDNYEYLSSEEILPPAKVE